MGWRIEHYTLEINLILLVLCCHCTTHLWMLYNIRIFTSRKLVDVLLAYWIKNSAGVLLAYLMKNSAGVFLAYLIKNSADVLLAHLLKNSADLNISLFDKEVGWCSFSLSDKELGWCSFILSDKEWVVKWYAYPFTSPIYLPMQQDWQYRKCKKWKHKCRLWKRDI